MEGAAGGGGGEPRKERKPRTPRSSGDFVSELRASAAKHRASLSKLVEAEQTLEAKLATVRMQRTAAEGPLAEVEAILAAHPGLPLVDAESGEVVP